MMLKNKTMDKSNLMTVDQLLEYLPVPYGKDSIYQMTHHKKIPFKRMGKFLLFDKAEIDAWIDKKLNKQDGQTEYMG